MRLPSCRSLILAAVTSAGVGFSFFGTLMYFLWPTVLDAILASQLALAPGSQSFSMFEVTPLPIHFQFYFFNWTNPSELNNHSTKPVLEELGPYVFSEQRRKVIHGFNPSNSTITFLQNRTWFFLPELSNGSLEDLITTVNVPALVAAFAARKANPFQMLTLGVAVSTAKISTTRPVRHFLFEGYSDTLLTVSKTFSALSPVKYPFDKFGWFHPRNGSAEYDGVFNMFTGVADISRFGAIANWNYMNVTRYYQPGCNQVNGSAGEFFPPNRDKSSISMFISDICRALQLPYKGPTEVDGIPGYRFQAAPEIFDNQTSSPQNWCYCPSGPCPPNGAMDISSCKQGFGAPAFLSFPHFLHGDPSYREAVEGMSPDENEHKVFIDLEPKSGILMEVAAALQINILVEPNSAFPFVSGVPKIYFPCMWFRQSVRLNDELRNLVWLISLMPEGGSIMFLVMLSTGFVIIFGLGIYLLVARKPLKSKGRLKAADVSSSVSTRTKLRGKPDFIIKIPAFLVSLHPRRKRRLLKEARPVRFISGGNNPQFLIKQDGRLRTRRLDSVDMDGSSTVIPPIGVNEEIALRHILRLTASDTSSKYPTKPPVMGR